MAIDTFSKYRFEKTLPRYKETNEPLWTCAGLIQGEYVYYLPVIHSRDDVHIRLVIRSSIDSSGLAADTGTDSIRIWLETLHEGTWRNFGKGHPREYVTRVNGWETRMDELIRHLYRIALRVNRNVCPECQRHLYVKISKTEANLNAPFLSCDHGKDTERRSYFKWLDGRVKHA